MVELVILLEQSGYALAPSPLISNAFAGAVIAEAGSDEQKQRWLPGIASGEERGAAEFTNEPGPLVGAAAGSAVLVLADGDGAKLVETGAATLERLRLIDSTRAYFRRHGRWRRSLAGRHRARASTPGWSRSRPSSWGSPSARSTSRSTTPRNASSSAGRSAPTRRSRTGSPTCSGTVEEARSLTYYAAWCAEAEPESLPLAASMAKARASDAACRVTHDAIQTLGGIGFTWEHDIHFFLKRARVSAQLMGSPAQHRERVAGSRDSVRRPRSPPGLSVSARLRLGEPLEPVVRDRLPVGA